MLTRFVVFAMLLFLLLASCPQTVAQPVTTTRVAAAMLVGYQGGPGFQMQGLVLDLADGFPMQIRGQIGYARVAPGKSADARRIFINDATNGVAQKSGRQWELGLDLLYPLKTIGLGRSYLYGGPRHVRFTANFKYVGGNEDFDVVSRQWGMGIGLTSYFNISNRTDLVLSAGGEKYIKSALSGHDTSYSPDGDHVNPRNDFTYDDADEAIEQPTIQLRLMLGVSYRI